MGLPLRTPTSMLAPLLGLNPRSCAPWEAAGEMVKWFESWGIQWENRTVSLASSSTLAVGIWWRGTSG